MKEPTPEVSIIKTQFLFELLFLYQFMFGTIYRNRIFVIWVQLHIFSGAKQRGMDLELDGFTYVMTIDHRALYWKSNKMLDTKVALGSGPLISES